MIENRLIPYQKRLESYLDSVLPPADTRPETLHQAIRYSTLNAGKRLRACLVYLTGEMFNPSDASVNTDIGDRLDAAAAAIELIHAYSLVHDDLPCMDDDDLRRGKASCHIAYDEATAMLVGDALQSLAFELLASIDAPDDTICPALIRTLARAAGSQGMVGGQALDLAAEGKEPDMASLQNIHAMKTAALIEASVLMGAHAAGVSDPAHLKSLSTYGKALGLSFQIQDDILDITSDTATLGKQTGADISNNKATYPAIIGLPAAKDAAHEACSQAKIALSKLPFDTQSLEMLAEYAINRIY